ncbi:MAG: HEAT repeat domain-containing protein [Planctomycetota bacterium]|jgi:hypothetical protein
MAIKDTLTLLILALTFFLTCCAEKRLDLTKAVEQQDVESIIKEIKTGKTYDDRNNAFKALSMVRGSDAVDPLITALEDENRYIRAAAAHALGNIGDTRAVKPLLTALKYKTWRVPRPELKAIHKIGTSAVESLLVELKNEDPEIRRWAAVALRWIDDSRAVEPLVSAIEKETNSKTKNQMILQLRQMDLERAKEFQEFVKIPEEKAIPEKAIFITEFVHYDQFGRFKTVDLKNIQGKTIAEKTFEFHAYNDTLISKEIITEFPVPKKIQIIDYNQYGQKLNPKLLCLDNDGNVLRKNGNFVLVDYFKARQQRVTRHTYKPFTKDRLFSKTKIYPCTNCSSATGIKNCAYVW